MWKKVHLENSLSDLVSALVDWRSLRNCITCAYDKTSQHKGLHSSLAGQDTSPPKPSTSKQPPSSAATENLFQPFTTIIINRSSNWHASTCHTGKPRLDQDIAKVRASKLGRHSQWTSTKHAESKSYHLHQLQIPTSAAWVSFSPFH